MEANLFCQSKLTSFTCHLPRPSRVQRYKVYHSLIVRAALTKSPDNLNGVTKDKNISWKKVDSNELVQEKNVYHDNWFDLLAINYLSKSVQAATGLKNGKSGYEGLVQSARDASLKFSLEEQRGLVLQALDHAVPKPIQALIKAVLPNTKFMREYFTAFTCLFFVWLIGPCEVRESEFNGSKEKNVVHMKKCRFLEETNCVGMCTNLCKVPSQTFIKNSLGMSVNMVPNFDDMSCEMIFGQEPPAITDDPAFQQPCYKLCKAKTKHSMKCSSS